MRPAPCGGRSCPCPTTPWPARPPLPQLLQPRVRPAWALGSSRAPVFSARLLLAAVFFRFSPLAAPHGARTWGGGSSTRVAFWGGFVLPPGDLAPFWLAGPDSCWCPVTAAGLGDGRCRPPAPLAAASPSGAPGASQAQRQSPLQNWGCTKHPEACNPPHPPKKKKK